MGSAQISLINILDKIKDIKFVSKNLKPKYIKYTNIKTKMLPCFNNLIS